MNIQTTRTDRIISRIKNNRTASFVIALGIIIIAVATFTDALRGLDRLRASYSPGAARSELSRLSIPYSDKAFIERVKQRDLNAVNLFLTVGMNPNTTDDEGRQSTALMIAARKGYPEIVNALLKADADVNGQDDYHTISLRSAVFGGNFKILQVLVDKGANDEAINDGYLAAASEARVDMLHLLARRGASVRKSGEPLRAIL